MSVAPTPARSATVELRPHSPRAIAANRGHILLVDDDPVIALTMEYRLKNCGYTVTLAAGPAAADTALARSDFDLILSDVHMPGNHRLEWTESLLARRCPAPILLMTGNPALETACRAANLPVAGYLIKPPDWEILDACLQQTISSQRRRGDFVGLARAILDLVESSGGPGDEVLVHRLASLAASFLSENGRRSLPGEVLPTDHHWRAVLAETVAVIEKTRHSFRSKELGQLRQRLQQFLALPAG